MRETIENPHQLMMSSLSSQLPKDFLMFNLFTEPYLAISESANEYMTYVPFLQIGMHLINVDKFQVTFKQNIPNSDIQSCGYEAFVESTRANITLNQYRNVVGETQNFSEMSFVSIVDYLRVQQQFVNLLVISKK